MRLRPNLFPPEVVRLVNDPRPMDELVAEYMGRQDPAYQAAVAEDVRTMGGRATDAFMEARGVQVPVPMIIAAEEERYIAHALAQYANQPNSPTFSVLGYLNRPEDAAPHRIANMRGLLDDFIARNPGVPFGYIEGVIDDFSPPRERRRAADALLSFTAADDPSDMLVVPHDADTVALSPNHFGALWHPFARHRFVLSVIPHVTHARTANLLNMDKVVEWWEESQQATGDYFEPGPGLSARAIMAVDSYNDEDFLGETHGLITRIHGRDARLGIPGSVAVGNAVLTLSPRRFYDRFYQGGGSLQIWSTDEPLTAYDDYRRLSSLHFEHWPDTDDRRRDDMLRSYGAAALQRAFDWRVARGMSPGRALRLSRRALEDIRRRIGGPEDMITAAARAMSEQKPKITDTTDPADYEGLDDL
jgi:hypothetical protein